MTTLSLHALAIVVLALSFKQVLSQDGVKTGSVDCESLVPMKDFNLLKYRGRWNVYKMYPRYPRYDIISCPAFDYVKKDDYQNGTFEYLLTEADGTKKPTIDDATLKGRKNQKYYDNNLGADWTNFYSNYYVLGTDYTDYSIVYSCPKAGEGTLDYAFVMSRKTLNSRQTKKLDEIIQNYAPPLNVSALIDVGSGCKSN